MNLVNRQQEMKTLNKHVGLSILYKLKEKAKVVKWKNDSRKNTIYYFQSLGLVRSL